MSLSKRTRGVKRASNWEDAATTIVTNVGTKILKSAINRLTDAVAPRATASVSSRSNTSRSLNEDREELKKIHAAGEYVLSKRVPGVNYRLKAAKYLKMDPLLKAMLFPMSTIRDVFSFRSLSGGPGLTGKLDGLNWNNNRFAQLQQVGRYRGLALFRIRGNAKDDLGAAWQLSSDLQETGQIDDGLVNVNINTQVRVFGNGPVCANLGNGSQVTQGACQSIVVNGPLVANSSTMTVLDVTCNQHTVQQLASQGQASYLYGAQGFSGVTNSGGTLWTPGSDILEQGGSNWYYKYNLQDAVWRVADGCVTMDIANAYETCCVVEIVIHQMKKTAHNIDMQSLYDGIYAGVDWYQKRFQTSYGPNNETLLSDANPTGGWQAFYDPKYPLLKVPGQASKFVRDVAVEVHRSVHYLEPGQSKEVKLYLGALYNSVSSMYDVDYDANGFNALHKDDIAGTLMVAIGHSGFEMFETSVLGPTDGGYPANPIGTGNGSNLGTLVGKGPSPSAIIVNGTIAEKFYPMSFNWQNRNIGPTGVYRPSYCNQNGGSIALPQLNIISNKVNAITSNDGSVPIYKAE